MHYSPFRRATRIPKDTFALDLHGLVTPPAFVLSQDQTLHLKFLTTRTFAGACCFQRRYLIFAPKHPLIQRVSGQGLGSKSCYSDRIASRGFEPVRLNKSTDLFKLSALLVDDDRDNRHQPRPQPRDGYTVYLSNNLLPAITINCRFPCKGVNLLYTYRLTWQPYYTLTSSILFVNTL